MSGSSVVVGTGHGSKQFPYFIGHLKLTDFGLSRRLSQGARAYTICGTLQYMGEREVKAGGEDDKRM